MNIGVFDVQHKSIGSAELVLVLVAENRGGNVLGAEMSGAEMS